MAVATRVSQADAIICDSTGKLVLCSEAPMGCAHRGMMINAPYLQEVFRRFSAQVWFMISASWQVCIRTPAMW